MLYRYVSNDGKFRGGFFVANKEKAFSDRYFLCEPVFTRKKQSLPFFEGLYLLLEEGNNVFTSLKILYESEEYGREKKKVKKIIDMMEMGELFSNAVGMVYGLGTFEISFLKIAEENGDIKDSLSEINEYLSRKNDLRNKLINALSYPVFILFLSIPLIILISKFLMPVFQDMYAAFGGELPAISKLALKIGTLIADYGFVTIIYIVLLVFLVNILFIFSPRLELKYKKFLYNKGIFKNIRHDLFQEIFFMEFSHLYKYNLSANKTIEIIKNSSGSFFVKKSLDDMLGDIELGVKIADAGASEFLFSNMSRMILKSLEQGNVIIAATKRLSEFYANRYRYKMEFITKMAGPIIVLLVGGIIAFMVIGTFVPVFSMSQFIR